MKTLNQDRRLLHKRSVLTIFIFTGAMIAAFWFPYIGFLLICVCLVIYLRPGASRM